MIFFFKKFNYYIKIKNYKKTLYRPPAVTSNHFWIKLKRLLSTEFRNLNVNAIILLAKLIH